MLHNSGHSQHEFPRGADFSCSSDSQQSISCLLNVQHAEHQSISISISEEERP